MDRPLPMGEADDIIGSDAGEETREALERRREALTRWRPSKPRPERPPPARKTRAQMGLDFLRRDLGELVARTATVEPLRPRATTTLRTTPARGGGKRRVPRDGTTRKITDAYVPVVFESPDIAASTLKPPRSEGERTARAARTATRRVAEARRDSTEAALAKRLPEPCDFQRAVLLGVPEKIKTANACARHLNLASRYRLVTRPPRSVHVEAFPATGEGTTVKKSAPPPRAMTVDAFVRAEARLWAQANYLETNALRAIHPTKRETRPLSEAERVIAMDRG